MPAQSKAQQRFMGMVHAAQKGEEPASPEVAKVAKSMDDKDAKDFASTSHKGLPNRVKQEILNRLKNEYGLMLPGHNIKPASPAQSLDDLQGVDESKLNESWTVKDGSVLSNGKLIGYYDFDRDSDSFWVDDVKKGKGQLSFDTKKEVEDYFKKNEKDAVKHLGKLRESTNPSDIIKDLDKVRTDLIKQVDVLIAKKKKLYSNVDIESPMSADEKKLDKDIQNIFSQIQQLIQQKRKIKTESVNADEINSSIIPAALKVRFERALELTQGKELTYNQKLKLLAMVIDSLGVDKSELSKISSKLKTNLD